MAAGVLQDLDGKVAVVTGGASGIGRALVDALAAEGMRVVVSDIEAPALDQAVRELTDAGRTAIGVVTDVTDFDSVAALADAAYDAFGAVHLLVNNAGVGPPSAKVWDTTPNDWRWTFGVNVFGVANGVMAFVPRMLDGGEPGLIINTSSTDGPIAPMPQASVYAATKSAVTTITECLAAQLTEEDTLLRAAVFYPTGKGLLDTGLWTSDRNRPDELARERPRSTPAMTIASLREMAEKNGGELPLQPLDELAQMVVDGIRDGRFIMIMPSDKTEQTLRERLEKIVRNENPTHSHAIG
jgi:NAD(P)-dependent dehydrogenase (short-subunit alcohol dehydrogenase family)